MGAEAVQVDLKDPEAVRRAAEKAELAFFHAPMGLSGGNQEGSERRAIRAILDGGVRQLAFNVGFALPAEETGVPPMDTRIALVNELLEEGKTTVFVPTGYLENFLAPWSAPHILDGELLYPLSPHVRVSWVTNEDIGRAAAAAFTLPQARGRRLRVAGPAALTMPEVAEQIGKALGRKVVFRQISGGEYAELLAPFVGRETADMIGSNYDRMADEQNPLMTPDITETEELLGMRFSTVYEWAKARSWKED
jgi:uncharacterized protein YbjT (DUF2867 family)